MTWLKLDDGFTRHPRMVAAGLHGRALFIAGLCYCGTHLTDGMIPKAAFPMLCAEAGVPGKTWRKLIEVGSWLDRGELVEVHDFLVYNPSRAKVTADREAARERMSKRRGSSPEHDENADGSSSSPSRPVPSPTSSSSNRSSRPLPSDIWTKTAEAKLKLQSDGAVKQPGAWLKTTARTSRDELADKAQDWWNGYDVSPLQLASALADGKVPPSWNNCRRVNA